MYVIWLYYLYIIYIGDAAHSTGGTLGQGANSALLDVVALSKCLDTANDDLKVMLPLFSSTQGILYIIYYRILYLLYTIYYCILYIIV